MKHIHNFFYCINYIFRGFCVFRTCLESKSGIFRPARPFSSFSSVGHSAAIFGSIACVQQLSSKSLAFLRQNDDFLNDIAGFGVAYKYYSYFLGSSEKRLILHNRAFGGIVLGAVLYGHIVV